MHVLSFRGEPEAVAERFQRLCMEMANYSAEEQDEMRIKAVPVLD